MLLAFSPSKTQTKFWEKKVLNSIKRVKNSLIHTPTDRPRLKRQLAFLFLNVTNFFPLKNLRQNFLSDQTKFRLRRNFVWGSDENFFVWGGHQTKFRPRRNSETKFRPRVFAKVMLKRAYWPERVGKACEWSGCPPGCNYLTLLPLLEGFKVAKNFFAFPTLIKETK